jgi:hypothetical protein
MKRWFYSGASVIGQSHLSMATPCQDKFKIQTSSDGEWIAVAVCDGAGSAEFAEQGASITSTHFCNELIKLSQELASRPPGEWINDFVIDCVIRVREQLRKSANSDDIRKYHSTLVAALMGRSGGFSIHIGDGALFGGTFDNSKPGNAIELNSNYVISKPENGEYSNETFFITEGSWVKHLRITPLPALDWLVACTDGGASLLLDNENEVKPSFLAPFIEAQINDGFQNSKYIETILNDPKANKLTTDDKTIVLAVREGIVPLTASLKFTPIPKVVTASLPSNVLSVKDGTDSSNNSVLSSQALNSNAPVTTNSTPVSLVKKNSHQPQKLRKSTFVLNSILFAFISAALAISIWLLLDKDLRSKFILLSRSTQQEITPPATQTPSATQPTSSFESTSESNDK